MLYLFTLSFTPQTEIHDLCQLLSNKLEFLSINKDGLNKLVILLIQMEVNHN